MFKPQAQFWSLWGSVVTAIFLHSVNREMLYCRPPASPKFGLLLKRVFNCGLDVFWKILVDVLSLLCSELCSEGQKASLHTNRYPRNSFLLLPLSSPDWHTCQPSAGSKCRCWVHQLSDAQEITKDLHWCLSIARNCVVLTLEEPVSAGRSVHWGIGTFQVCWSYKSLKTSVLLQFPVLVFFVRRHEPTQWKQLEELNEPDSKAVGLEAS